MPGMLLYHLRRLDEDGADVGQVLGAHGVGLADNAAGFRYHVPAGKVVERVGGNIIAALLTRAAVKNIHHIVQSVLHDGFHHVFVCFQSDPPFIFLYHLMGNLSMMADRFLGNCPLWTTPR